MATSRSSSKKQYLTLCFLAATIAISIAGSVLLILNWEWVEGLSSQGYLGLFLVAVFAGSPLPIPTPNLILTFTMGSLLNPLLVGVISGLGNGIGNALIYWTGRGGLLFFQNLRIPKPADENSSSRIGRFFRKIKMPRIPDFLKRKALVAVFILSLYPNPVLGPIILGMGAKRYSFTKFYIVVTAGKMVEALLLSYLGYFGLGSLLRFIGIFSVN
jgi:membrane protein YqaA with SNARE-associated domain